jgi:hypothetical protein
MDCYTICALISVILKKIEIRQFCGQRGRWNGYFIATELCDDTILHRKIHEACHKKWAFSKVLQRLLDAKYQEVIDTTTAMPIPEVYQHFTTSTLYDTLDISGFLWAVATDPREEMRVIEHNMLQHIHTYVVPHHSHPCTTLEPTYLADNSDRLQEGKEHNIEMLHQELQKVKRKLADSYAKRDNMAREKLTLETRVFQLQQENSILKKQSQPVVEHVVRMKKLKKEIYTLAQEVEQLQSTLQAKEKEINILHTVVSEQSREIEELAQRLLQFLALPPPNTVGTPPFCGQRIALIGGIDRLDIHYRAAIESQGAVYRRHNGNCKAGDQALRTLIKQSDIVLFSVDCNSHIATQKVKELCKAYRKPFYVLYSSGVSQMKKKLLEIGPPQGLKVTLSEKPISCQTKV